MIFKSIIISIIFCFAWQAQRMRETLAHSEREQKNQVDPVIENNNSNGTKLVEPKKYALIKLIDNFDFNSFFLCFQLAFKCQNHRLNVQPHKLKRCDSSVIKKSDN